MAERNDLLGCFEFLIAGEVARAVKERVGVAQSGPSFAVASRAIEDYGPALIRRLWAYIGGRPEDEVARILEALANLDDRAAHELAEEAGAAFLELADMPEVARRELAAVLATIPAALRARLPRDDRGRSICPAGALPRDASALLRMIPLPSPASTPLPTRAPTGRTATSAPSPWWSHRRWATPTGRWPAATGSGTTTRSSNCSGAGGWAGCTAPGT